MVAEDTSMIQKPCDTQRVQIIIFTRFPLPGKTKTRLIPSLGPEGAADIQRKMTEFTVGQAAQTGFPIQIRYTGGTVAQMREWLGEQYEYARQSDGDLGARLKNAFAEAFERGAKKVLAVGCDCPDYRAENIRDTVKLLDKSSCVIGPATDGGYYQIGLCRFNPDLFDNVAWGTETVLRQTLAKINEYKLLPVLSDVDEPDDIPAKISVIIPVLNEEEHIESTVKQAMEGFETETIVIDGGSDDGTRDRARQVGARVFRTPACRATQMNYGANQATGDILLFLHADSALPPAWDCHIRQVIKMPDTILGYFRFAINGSFAGKRWIETGTNIRSRFLKKPYGDQGLFLKKNTFTRLKGFPEVPILEDVLIVKEAKKMGHIRCASSVLLTSGRRWRKLGWFRTMYINQSVLLLARLGVDLDKLNHVYRNGKNPVLVFFEKQADKK